jgi:hypothetical protein
MLKSEVSEAHYVLCSNLERKCSKSQLIILNKMPRAQGIAPQYFTPKLQKRKRNVMTTFNRWALIE